MIKKPRLIQLLETKVGKRLDLCNYEETVAFRNNGFAVNNSGEVIGLNLDGMELGCIPELLSNFHSLEAISMHGLENTNICQDQKCIYIYSLCVHVSLFFFILRKHH